MGSVAFFWGRPLGGEESVLLFNGVAPHSGLLECPGDLAKDCAFVSLPYIQGR